MHAHFLITRLNWTVYTFTPLNFSGSHGLAVCLYIQSKPRYFIIMSVVYYLWILNRPTCHLPDEIHLILSCIYHYYHYVKENNKFIWFYHYKYRLDIYFESMKVLCHKLEPRNDDYLNFHSSKYIYSVLKTFIQKKKKNEITTSLTFVPPHNIR